MKSCLSWLVLASLPWTVTLAAVAQEPAPVKPAEQAQAAPPPQAPAQAPEAAPAQAPAPAPAQAQPVQAPIEVLPSPAPTPQPQRIEATVEQLEELINAPEEAQLGREVDENLNQPFALFNDKKRIEDLLGDNPSYVYIPSGTDPMIVPWIRNRVMAAELVSEAAELKSTGKYQDALDKVNLVLERFGDSDSVDKARKLKQELEMLASSPGETPRLPVPTDPTPPTLPIWIPENTRGVVYDVNDPANSSVLIGEYILRAGETIPSYPGIKVVAIGRSEVTLDYQGQVFRLPVEGN